MPDRERVYPTEAIVLKHADFGEADRLLTVLTPHLGKLRLLAKGVRRPRSRKSGHLESFTRTQLLVARGRNLDIVTQAQLIDPHLDLRQDLARMSHACYVAELAEAFGEEEAENEALYSLLAVTLRRICDTSDLALALRWFESQLLYLVGYRPQLFRCARCQHELEPVESFFSAEEGGMLCPGCAEGNPSGARAVSLPAFKVLRFLQTRSFADCSGLQLRPATCAEVESVLHGYLVYILERKVKSVEFLDTLRRNGVHPH